MSQYDDLSLLYNTMSTGLNIPKHIVPNASFHGIRLSIFIFNA